MDDDQQFCLRWNNHQSTLVAVFDTLLENGTLVDCTLAAEGKYLNAHKVVLSACSPYFESLLSKHFDKHPILILKDVKFQELKAMMDYMYRGEVNISQDQLGALLKAAESLQIKGLSDNRKGETERKVAPVPPPPKSPQPAATLPKVQGLTIEQRTRDDSREGSMSPGPRKKKRLRRKSEDLDNHDASNSSESHSLPAQNIPSSLPATSKMNADVPEPIETKSEILTRHKQTEDIPQVPIIKEKLETHTELMLEPKSEYVEEMNEDSIEDLTLDDDDLSNMEQMDDQAGPSHGNAGEGSSQGFGGWHMGNQSQDEVFLAAQEAVGAHRDSQAKRKLKGKADNLRDLLETIIRNQNEHSFVLKDIRQKVTRYSSEGEVDEKNLLGLDFQLPCENLESLVELELYVSSHIGQFIKLIEKIGGDDGRDYTYRCLKTLFTNSLGEICSWTGQKSNYAVGHLKLLELVFDVVHRKTNCTKKEFEYYTKEWFRHSKQRREREDKRRER